MIAHKLSPTKGVALRHAYPLLLAAYPVLAMFAANHAQLTLSALVWPSAVSAIGAIVVYGLCGLLLDEGWKARLLTAAAIILFFAYGRVYEFGFDLLNNTVIGSRDNARLPIGLHVILTSLGLACLVLIRRFLRKSRPTVARLDPILTTFSVFLLIMPSISLLASSTQREKVGQPVAKLGRVADDTPDIYLLVFDSYPRADALREVYGFDNGAFLDFLRSRGFQIAEESRSNYDRTFLALASLLNLDYVSSLRRQRGIDFDGQTDIFRMIRSNRVVRVLKDAGFVYVHMNSTYQGTSTSDDADVTLRCGTSASNALQRLLFRTTWLRVVDFWVGREVARCHKSNFESLRAAARLPGPKFVFAHFMPPHPPLLFDRDGTIIQRRGLINQFGNENQFNDGLAFVAQLEYVNDEIMATVDAILAPSGENPPIIAILSDHGVRPNGRYNLRFANLTALHLPGDVPLPEGISPVNIFRLIFSHYLGMDIDLLPDHSYESTWHPPFTARRVDDLGLQRDPGRAGQR